MRCWRHIRRSLAVLVAFMAWVMGGHGAETPEGLLDRWLAAQTNLQSLAADLIQTRSLRSLAQPVVTPGRLYFGAPASFRWELGAPPQTLALRRSNQLWVVYPAQKRMEVVDLQQAGTRWRETLALLEAGFPRSRAELESRYRVGRVWLSNGVVEVQLTPRQAAVRRLVPELKLGFRPGENHLCYTALTMADGSQMRQDFTNVVINPQWRESPFVWTPPPDYQVVEPLRRGGGGR